ncbi:HAD superfamily hydrolase (TIGR01490 family) [Inhella inkyongensis]|uniref:HAD superfamily hydrolase (TIGR01490 family) n=1 Tax=Inhella inkyongensis TaxID=392593 RepID=A0A840S8Z6_9BURK|nr:HAD family hydrolase [Inhella inkyongensis]MBB5206113.1 HAD superfamily hydrolase (TIGR01490 family) [Inhella inkyongensis]
MNLTLFDLDGTLLPIDSDHAFGDFLAAQGWVDGASWRARNDGFYQDYCEGRLDLDAYVAFTTGGWRQRPLAEALQLRQRFMDEVLLPALHDNARALVERHRAAGDLMALVTATNVFVTAPIAQAFGFEHLIGVELERDASGAYTGAVAGVPSFQAGKITRVNQWLAGLGRRFEEFECSTCYSDSMNDLPLLEAVSHPVATNPSAALEALAQERGWPILKLFK